MIDFILLELLSKTINRKNSRVYSDLMSNLEVFNHGGVVNVLCLKVIFDWLQDMEGNSDIHGIRHSSHPPPKIQLKEQKYINQSIQKKFLLNLENL